MLNKSLVNDVLTAALSTGGDFAEIFVEDTINNNILLTNGIIEKAISGIDYGAGIRIFDGLNAIYAYTNDTSYDNFIRIAKEAAAAISKKRMNQVNEFISKEIPNHHKVHKMPNTILKKDICHILKEASSSAFSFNNRITQTTGTYLDVVQKVLIANSEGLWVEDTRIRTRVGISTVASNETQKQMSGYSPGASRGFEFVESLDLNALARESAEISLTMLDAEECPSGRMPVVIDNGFGGVIFHEACGHSLEATGVAKGASEFSGKLGQKIASDLVTAIDDGTLINEWGSLNIDDEGTKTRKNVLIENGILKSYLVDRLNGMKMGMESTGSSRRQSYSFAPTSRMNNTYIAAGKSKLSELISSCEYGLYAKKMGGGSVQPATGEFNFSVLEGYLIRNGKIAEPVRGATLIGKGSEVLMNIDMVADNLRMEQGMCGSISGSVPTNVGQPAIRVKELTVGGKR